MKYIAVTSILLFLSLPIFAQKTKEELQREQQQLKAELAETQRLQSENKSKTTEGLYDLRLAEKKVSLQDRVIDNINNDIFLLDKSLIQTQRDINRFDKLLDTLKQEYAKSMVYAYKNRNNYDFLNFIFASKNFNDALKRISYLKSYRQYREIQGQNILRTQELRKERVAQLTGTKYQKSQTLDAKDKELALLEKEKLEKDRIVSQLKKQGGDLAKRYASAQARYRNTEQKIQAMIKMEIAKRIAEAKKQAALAAAKRKADEDAANKKAAAEAAAAKAAAAKNNTNASTATTKPITKPATKPVVKPVVPKTVSSEPNVLLDEGNTKTDVNFKGAKGNLPWPANGQVIQKFGRNVMPITGTIVEQTCTTVGVTVGTAVKAVFSGVVTSVIEGEDVTVCIQHGSYFTIFSNLYDATVSKGQTVTQGQVIGKAMANIHGGGSFDIYVVDGKGKYYDPETWLRR
jgi:murein hydrolase activator